MPRYEIPSMDFSLEIEKKKLTPIRENTARIFAIFDFIKVSLRRKYELVVIISQSKKKKKIKKKEKKSKLKKKNMLVI